MNPTRTRASGHERSQQMRRVVLRRGAHAPTLASGPRPEPRGGLAIAKTLLVGLDGTDTELLQDDDGAFPRGDDEIVLGHECLAEIVDAPEGSGLSHGDRVVPLVRHACGACAMCAKGHADLCTSGRYVEHGIRGLHGFLQDEWVDDAATLVKAPRALEDLAVLTEPLSIVVKALDVCSSIQARIPGFEGFQGARVLLAGTGSLGTLAGFALALEGAKMHALDRSSDDAAAARLLARLGATHVDARDKSLQALTAETGGFDLIIEATGSPRVAFDAALALRPNGILCLLGVPPERPAIPIEADDVMRTLVLKNACIVGSVNSNARHLEIAMQLLARFRDRWGGLVDEIITHRYSPEEAVEAFRADDETLIKKVIDWR